MLVPPGRLRTGQTSRVDADRDGDRLRVGSNHDSDSKRTVTRVNSNQRVHHEGREAHEGKEWRITSLCDLHTIIMLENLPGLGKFVSDLPFRNTGISRAKYARHAKVA
jgi:hypothetical protein